VAVSRRAQFSRHAVAKRCAATCIALSAAIALGACSFVDAQHCTVDRDCGEGYFCATSHACEPVVSFVGQPCTRENDCGPGQTCALEAIDIDHDDGVPDKLVATCQFERAGRDPGARCAFDGDCTAGACVVGRCASLCVADDDCVSAQTCATVPRTLGPTGEGLFAACVTASGVAQAELPVGRDGSVDVPVPSNVRSFTIVTDAPDADSLAGLARLESPNGAVLYQSTDNPDDYWTQPVRYVPLPQTSSLRVPTSTSAAVELGVYRAQARAFAPGRLPRVTVVYRLGTDGHVLDVNVHLVDLAGHPCPGAALIAADTDDPASPFNQQFLRAWRGALAPAGLSIGAVQVSDLVGHPELDAIDSNDELAALLALGEPGAPALDVFVVRSIYPLGVSAVVSSTPGPLVAGTRHSGVVLSADALCTHGWTTMGQLAARATARYLGLHESVDVDDHRDPLASTDDSQDNLLYFRLQATDLTTEQADILRRSPLLR
jgi:hypothetical protein